MLNGEALTVSGLNKKVKNLLENQFYETLVTGEVSTFSSPASGHWYFTLKDETAQVRCAMFRQCNQAYQATYKRPKLEQGEAILVLAVATLYPARGDYQLVVSQIQPVGTGYLQHQLGLLKLRLEQEGLFNKANKPPLPLNPKTIGVVTSPTGAAVRDIIHVLHRRDPSIHIIVYPSLVQGQEAAKQIVESIGVANRRRECDVLIVGRGGGSLEDLWCFNEEAVARAIHSSAIPIVSAVGHEVDFTLSDEVASFRAATPSAAAEALSVDHSTRVVQLRTMCDQLTSAYDYLRSFYHNLFERLVLKLKAQHPKLLLRRQKSYLVELLYRLRGGTSHRLMCLNTSLRKLIQICIHKNPEKIAQKAQALIKQKQLSLTYLLQKKITYQSYRVSLLSEQLNGQNPYQFLDKGYTCLKTSEGKLLKTIGETYIGQALNFHLKDGIVEAVVNKIVTIEKAI